MHTTTETAWANLTTEALVFALVDARRRHRTTPKGFTRGVWASRARNIAAELRTRRTA